MKLLAKLLALSAIFFSSCSSNTDTLFEPVSSAESGIEFNNQIVESDSMNMLDYEYLYSGGGIAVADFNNDGLSDLYFVGNVVSNHLYLNQGKMQFKNATEAANAGSTGQWHTGVSTVDINNDGWVDIYLSVARSEIPGERKNVLLIHQGLNEEGIPVFKDQAEDYGLASTSFSTQTAFFDYDNDGDLDMYEVVADKRREGRQNRNRNNTRRTEENTDNLFRNDWDSTRGHPYYTEVSKQSGIIKAGYGLGINIADINSDGWKDIYVSNDFVSNDLLWINNGDGTFTDKASIYFKHTSFSGMGSDVADINNDGLMDFMTLDMAGSNNVQKQTMSSPNNYQNYFSDAFKDFDPQFTRNTLQLNQGDLPTSENENHPVFGEVALLSGVAETNWSWGVLMADFNNDRFNDMVITNGIPRNKIDKDFVQFRNQMSNIASNSMLLDSIPRDKSQNFIYQNNGDVTFTESTREWGFDEPAYSMGIAWADLDNDGDLDVIMNNINDRAFVYENTLNEKKKNAHWLKVRFEGPDKNKQGIGAIVDIYKEDLHQTRQHFPYRGYLSTVEKGVHFGLGDITELDSVVIRWGNGELKQTWTDVQSNQTIVARYNKATKAVQDSSKSNSLFTDVTEKKDVQFVHTEQGYSDFKVQRMLPYKLSQFGPALAAGDVNGDNLQDLFIGGSLKQQGSFLIQQETGSFEEIPFQPDGRNSNWMREDAGILLFDADNDGDQDLYIVSGSVENPPENSAYQDRFYENDGNGDFTYRPDALPSFRTSGSAVRAADFDRDGDLDLFVGGRTLPQFYPAPVSSYVLRNDTKNGTPEFTDATDSVASALGEIGMVTDALWTDFNNDGWQDLIIAGEWMPITFLQNNSGKFENVTDQTGIQNKKGWWYSLVGGDFDNDGDTDYVAGNLGLNTIYKASEEEPVRVYADDFDGNGAYDAILTLFNSDTLGNSKEYPAHKYEDFHWQLPRRAQKISSVEEYATSTIHDLFTDQELSGALTYEANEFRTSYIENKGNGNFEMTPLPTKAQFAPIFGMVTDDVTGDGNLDLVLNGNLFGSEVQVGSYDALNGLLLRGDGEGGFDAASMAESGIYIPGDGKSLAKFRSADDSYLLAASQNQGPIKIFEKEAKHRIWNPGPMDAYGMLYFSDGSQQRHEFYYGSSFQSASDRLLLIPEKVDSMVVYDYQGEKRQVQKYK